MIIKQKVKIRRFIVMNSQCQFFCGLRYGGELVWTDDSNRAKPLDDERKFKTLQSLCRGEELIMDYIN